MPELSIVIVNYNAGRYIADCLRSLFENAPAVPWEVVVIDNASTDGSPAAVRRDFPEAALFARPANAGFAAACNLGAHRSSGKYILFLNPDTVVPPGTLDAAVAFMEAHGEAGVMGCRTVGSRGRLQPTAFDFPAPFRVFGLFSGLNRLFKVTRLKNLSRTRRPDYVQGSFLLARREVFESLGGFDEGFFMYAEDVDLCLRVRRAGREVYYVPDIFITHHGGRSAGDSLETLEYYVKSLGRLYAKHRTPGEGRRLRRAMRLGLRLREVFWAGGRILSMKPIKGAGLRACRKLICLTRSPEP